MTAARQAAEAALNAGVPAVQIAVGSVTKQFTVAPRASNSGTNFSMRSPIALRQLLSHTAGVRREWFPPTAQLDLTAPVTREEVIKALNEGQLFDFPPGKAWSYSNAGFMLLGLAIESITGMPFGDFVHHDSRCRSGSWTQGCAERPTCRCLEATP